MPQPAPNQLLQQGLQHQRRGELRQAEELYRQVLALDPNHPNALHLLGFLLGQTGHKQAAVELIRRAAALDPKDPTMLNNLGLLLGDLGRFNEAVIALQDAVQLVPGSAITRYNLATALENIDEFDDAILAYREALRLDPKNAAAFNNLSGLYAARGELDEALGAVRQAVRLSPGQPLIHSNLIIILQFHPGPNAAVLREELAAWKRLYADPLKTSLHPYANDRTPDRPLRIGYVSPDFCDQVVGRNILPLVQHHDPRQFQVFCFAAGTAQDAMTERFRGLAKGFLSIAGLSDLQAAELIRASAIDVLVDLALHTVNNRLPLFALKPAPVQVTFAGYPGTTGLDTIDYRLTDPFLDPPGQDDSIYSETSVRLPHSFWCFDPHLETLPVNDLPALSAGHVTFGCLNTFRKINTPVLQSWAEILRAVPSSRLMMFAPPAGRPRVVELLAKHGISSNRLSFQDPLPRREYLALYRGIDIGLDTLPYNGHTTSLESLFMGVPVVTQIGNTVVGRAGLSQLSNLGLPELIARTAEEYVRIAVDLAGDLPRLGALRSTLRQRMRNSPLMDAPGFARGIEAAYRQMWRTWCAKAPAL